MAGIGIELGLHELGSKFGYRNWDRNWVTGTGIEVWLQESEVGLGIGSEVVLQELRSKLVTGIENGS